MLDPWANLYAAAIQAGGQLMDVSRRNLLKTASTTGLGAIGLAATEGYSLLSETAVAQAQTYPTPPQTKSGEMIYRTLGQTKERVSVIGLGGYHIGKIQTEQESIQLIRRAIDRGINYERYKTTPQNDSTAMNLAWLG